MLCVHATAEFLLLGTDSASRVEVVDGENAHPTTIISHPYRLRERTGFETRMRDALREPADDTLFHMNREDRDALVTFAEQNRRSELRSIHIFSKGRTLHERKFKRVERKGPDAQFARLNDWQSVLLQHMKHRTHDLAEGHLKCPSTLRMALQVSFHSVMR